MKKICFITGSRAEYGLLRDLMLKVKKHKNLKIQVIASCMHLMPKFGLTYKEILKDGFKIDHKVKMPISKSTPDNITKATGIGMIGFAKVLKKLKPDLVVVLGDRFEILAAAFAAHSEKIPIAHIGGGESTVGAIDESIRHSVTKMSALHFVTTKEYKNRVIQLGENPKNVFLVGSLGVDRMKKLKLYSKKELESKLKFKLAKNNILITYHPVTLDKVNEKKNIIALIKALNKFKDSKIIFTYPNVDSGSDFIVKQIKSFTKKNKKNTRIYKSLGDTTYLSLMKYVDLVIGNSSSGIIEAPSFKKIVINIGDRQLGRVKSKRIIELKNKKINPKSLIRYFKIGMSNKFKRKVQKSKNPYEIPNSANKIMKIISNFKKTNGSSIQKQFYNFKNNNNPKKILKEISIVGGGDIARKVSHLINRDKLFKISGYYNNKKTIKNLKYLGNFDSLIQNNLKKNKNIALSIGGRPNLIKERNYLIKILKKNKFKFPNIISKKAVIHKKAKLSKGIIVFDKAVIDFDTIVSDFTLVNIGSVVCHDTYVGQNVIISPNSTILGKCKIIGDTFIGSGSSINPRVKITKNVVIGAMSNVLKNITKQGVYVGNPCRKYK